MEIIFVATLFILGTLAFQESCEPSFSEDRDFDFKVLSRVIMVIAAIVWLTAFGCSVQVMDLLAGVTSLAAIFSLETYPDPDPQIDN